MEKRQIYEYVVVKAEWFGSLDKGTRLYYDYDKNGYVYHYEYEKTEKNSRYNSTSYEEVDYFMSLDVVESNLRADNLVAGPELGILENKCADCKDCKCEQNGL